MNQRNSKEILWTSWTAGGSYCLEPSQIDLIHVPVCFQSWLSVGCGVAITTASWAFLLVTPSAHLYPVRFRTSSLIYHNDISVEEVLIYERDSWFTAILSRASFSLVTSLVFILMFLTSGLHHQRIYFLYQFGFVYPPAIKAMPEQVWRLPPATLSGLAAPFVNMLSLYLLGRQMEQTFGSKQFFFIYLLSVWWEIFCPRF